MCFLVKVRVKVAKVGLVLMFYLSGLFRQEYKWLKMKQRRRWLQKLWFRRGRIIWGHKTFKHSAHELKLFVKPGVICVLFFAKSEDSLMCSQIHVSSKKIIVGNKHFKVGNRLLKKDVENFSKIAMETEKRSLYGPCLPFWKGVKGRLDRIVWGQDMINNLLGVRVNLRVLKVVGVLLVLGYATGQLKNFAGRGRQQKKRRQDT